MSATTIDPSIDAENKAVREHQLDSISLLILLALLVITVFTVWRFRIQAYKVLHETGVSMIFGMVAGIVIHAANVRSEHSTALVCNDTARAEYIAQHGNGDTLEDQAVFNPEVFFYVLLPPIIFSAGFTLQSKAFFENIGGILAFAFLGTSVSCFVVGFLMFLYTSLIQPMEWTLLDALSFGALISATDPVTVLAIFREMRVELDLYILVFGESVLNDAVSIVLYTSIETLRANSTDSVTAMSVFHSIWVFILIFCGSISCGILVGVFNALLTKFSNIRKHEMLEAALFVLLSYSSFLFAESFGLSGIVSILFCGLTQTHYTFHNLSPKSQTVVSHFFEVMNFLCENFIFSYIGLSLFTYRCHVFEPGFIVWSLLAIGIGRAVHVFPLSFCLNKIRRRGDSKITLKYQSVLLWAGLRGAIAFALSIRGANTDAKRMVLTTTMVIVFVTILFLGGGTAPLLRLLKIKSGVPDLQEDDLDGVPSQHGQGRIASFFRRVDHRYISPVVSVAKTQPGTSSWDEIKLSVRSFVFSPHDPATEESSPVAAPGDAGDNPHVAVA